MTGTVHDAAAESEQVILDLFIESATAHTIAWVRGGRAGWGACRGGR